MRLLKNERKYGTKEKKPREVRTVKGKNLKS